MIRSMINWLPCNACCGGNNNPVPNRASNYTSNDLGGNLGFGGDFQSGMQTPQDSKISILEKYILEPNKDAFIKTLVPNTSSYKYMVSLHELTNKGRNFSSNATEIFKKWKEEPQYMDSESKAILMRKLLIDLDHESSASKQKEIIKWIDQHHGCQIHRLTSIQKPVSFATGDEFREDKEDKMPSDITQSQAFSSLTLEGNQLEIYKEPHMLDQKYNSSIYPHLDMKKLAKESHEQAERVLKNSDTFASLKNLSDAIEVISSAIKKKQKYYSIPNRYFDQMTKTQLIACSKAVSGTRVQYEYWAALFKKSFDLDWDNVKTPADTQELLESIAIWVKKTFDSEFGEDFVACIRHFQLVNNVLQDALDLKLFKEYVKRPRSDLNYFTEKYRTQIYKFKQMNHRFWEKLLDVPQRLLAVLDSDMYDIYINEIVKSESNRSAHDWITKHFESNYLTRSKIKAELESGVEVKDIEKYFSEHELNQLRSSKTLRLEAFNQRKFGLNEKVQLTLKIKNVEQLTIKVFEVNTEAYYRKHKAAFKEDIDLDGLIPSSVKKYDLRMVSPLAGIKKSFEFPEIQTKVRGIFIVEFVGGGLSSRAIIRKGGLTLIQNPTAKGINFNIVNEAKEICKSGRVGILVGGQYYKADDLTGEILIPYGPKTVSENAVIIYRDFCDLAPISIPNEAYAFLTSLIFNEESLVAGSIAQLIIHPKLIFNGRAISIGYVKTPKVTITATNDAGVDSTTVYSDVKYSYEADTVIDYLVPPKLAKLEVKAEGVVTLVDGTEMKVSTQEYILISKKKGIDIYFDIYLQKLKDQYRLLLLGKNGEPFPQKIIKVEFMTKFLKSSYKLASELKTDHRGIITLGSLPDVTSITVAFPGTSLGSHQWELNTKKDQMHIQESYHICINEELVLPAMSQEPNAALHQLCKYSRKNKYLQDDFFKSFKKVGNTFVMSFPNPGLYIFKYLELGVSIEISVIDGKRWEHSPNFIVEDNQLTKMISDMSYMTLLDSNIKNGKLNLKLSSNNISKLKVHVLGFRHYPGYYPMIHNTMRKMCPHYARETYGFPYTENSFMSDKLLGDELNYVLERKNKPGFLGNTLEKPPVLLKRHFNRDTHPDNEILQTGKDFKSANLGEQKEAFMKADRAKLTMPPPRTFNVSRISDFNSIPGLVMANLKPNAKGELEVTIPNLENYSSLRIIATDVLANISLDMPLEDPKPRYTDVRLPKSKTRGLNYGMNRFALVAQEGKTLQIDNINETETFVVDNLETAAQIIKVIGRYNHRGTINKLDDWEFLGKWDKLSFDQKLRKFDEFVGHELNIFLYMKDRPFFDAYVRKYLFSKSRLDKLDVLLLGLEQEIAKLTDPTVIPTLKPIEVLFLVLHYRSSHPALCRQIISAAECMEVLTNNSSTEETFRKYFDTVLNHKHSLKEGTEAAVVQPPAVGGLAFLEKKSWHPGNYFGDFTGGRSGKGIGKGATKAARVTRAHPKITTTMAVRERAASICDSRSASSGSDGDDFQLEDDEDQHSQDEDEDEHSALSRSLQHSVQQVNKKRKAERDDDRDRDRRRDRDARRSRSASQESAASLALSAAYNQRTPEMNMQKLMNVGGIIEESSKLDRLVVVQHKKVEMTKEYIERNYFFNDDAQLSTLNSFWLNTIKGFFEHGLNYVNLDYNFILCCNSKAEMIIVLGLLSLPYSKAVLSTKREGNSLTIECNQGRLIQFCKQMNEKSTGKVDMDIIVTQSFYDPQDKFVYDEVNPSHKSLKKVDEFLVGKIYTSRIAVTNSSDAVLEIQLIAEIPQGAIPVNDLEYTKTYDLTLGVLETTVKEFNFYFPQEGQFEVFPATAIKNNMLVCFARVGEQGLRVVKKKTSKGLMESISEILVSGSKKDILAFIETKNIRNNKIFNFNDIYWLFKDEKFYLDVVEILRKRFIFDETTWSFSIYHGAKREYFEYLSFTKSHFGMKYLSLPSLKVDDFLIKEYNPMTNPRTHNIGNKKHNIANKEFKETYVEFLTYLMEKGPLDNRDKLVLSSYLILQDRIDEALAVAAQIKRDPSNEEEELKIQLDYLTAYLSLYTEHPNFATAKALSEKYIVHHVPTWRNRFVRIANQLTEYSGSTEFLATIEADGTNPNQLNPESRISKAEQLKVELRADKILVKSRNVPQVTVSYYEIDIEILFSKDPFFNKDMTNSFSDVFPTYREVVKIGSGVDEADNYIDIPEQVKTKNMLVYVQTSLLSEKVQFFPSELSVLVASDAGYVKVFSKEKRPLPQIYVKCFSQSSPSAAAVFYKDGYTDMRGVFDYTSLNEDKLGSVDKLSLLISSPTLGAVTRVVPRPSKLGVVAENEVLLSKELREAQEKVLQSRDVY